MFDVLSDRLEGIFTRLRGRGRLSGEDVDEALREIRLALLQADVNLLVVRDIISRLRAELVGSDLSRSLTPGQQVVKAVHDELVRVLGGTALKVTYAPRPPTVVLLAGLQGSGKTTAAAKLARWFKQQGRNPLLVGADLQRPAAVEQLRVLGAQVRVPVFSEPSDPVTVAKKGLAEAQRVGRDVLVVDTAGRLSIDAEMMEQARQISESVQPHYTFLVIDSMTGQDAVATAEAFHKTLALDGVILTKIDGDARGGAALSVKEVVGKPIAFASTGEKLEDFELFHPDRMAGRILGMGDVLTLIDKAEEAVEREDAERAMTKLVEGRFGLDDFLAQLQSVKKMGPLSGLIGMLPMVPKEIKNAQIDDSALTPVEAIIHSMTPEERAEPSIINGSRRARIAAGSGTSVQQVNELLERFKQAQAFMRQVPGLAGMTRRSSAKASGKKAGAKRKKRR
ncbi:MAG: signal recognition particle protein [Actinomycetota bacterium]|jgi:signal recognition particle subunit SRP54|nr:signal recognition particle protein [Actinomycetota bacterium]